jgi:hypothetical protein
MTGFYPYPVIFLPPAYSPALIYFGRERAWWITCNYPTVLKEKKTERVQPALSVGLSPYYMRKSVGKRKINKSWGVCGWQKNWIGKG